MPDATQSDKACRNDASAPFCREMSSPTVTIVRVVLPPHEVGSASLKVCEFAEAELKLVKQTFWFGSGMNGSELNVVPWTHGCPDGVPRTPGQIVTGKAGPPVL